MGPLPSLEQKLTTFPEATLQELLAITKISFLLLKTSKFLLKMTLYYLKID